MTQEERFAAFERIAYRAAKARLEGRIQAALNDERNLDTAINSIQHPIERDDANEARDRGTTRAMNE